MTMGSEGTRTAGQGRVALISGADGGIGRMIAKNLIDNGYRVSLGALDPSALSELFGSEAESQLYSKFDALDHGSAQDWVDRTVDHFGQIDVLINCAGHAEKVTLYDDNDDALDRLFAINAKAPLRLTRLCLPELEKTGHGRVVNLVSLAAKRVRNSAVGYAMSKYALLGVTHATRTLTWDKGVRATAICPGWVRTEMAMNGVGRQIEAEDMTSPETLAHLVRTTIELPNSAAIAELIVNCEFEDLY